jgi:hypothetical protein
MRTKNTKTMIVLLEALNVDFGYDENNIDILTSKDDFIHAVLSADDEIQQVFGGSTEWQEIINLIN